MKLANRSLSLFASAVAGVLVASAPLAQAGIGPAINIQVIPSSAPNFFGSPSFNGYMANAMTALQGGLPAVGDRNTDPTGYQAIPNGATIEAGEVMVTSFSSWRGFANPAAPFNNELGNRLHFGMIATGNGVQQFNVDSVTFTIDSNDPGNSLEYHDNLAGTTYNGTSRIGVNWGADRAPGGGDDVVYNSGQAGTLLVDQLFYVGAGNALWAGGGDPDPSNPIGGRQGAMYGTADYIYDNAPFTVTASYSIDGNVGAASVNVVPEPTTLGVFGIAALGLLARRRRR